jgi:hypothetical protein
MGKVVSKQKLLATIVLLGIFLALFSVPANPVFADTSTGGISISSVPQPSSIEIYEDSGYVANSTGLTPQDWQYINFTINDPDLIANLTWIRIVIWDDQYTNYDGALNHTRLTRYFWNEPTDVWNITEDGSSTWDINQTECIDPGTDYNGATYEFRLAFFAGKCAFEETTDQWKVNITAYDDESLEAYNTTIVTTGWAGTGDWYGELSITTGGTSYNFTASSPGAGNVSLYLIDGTADTHLNFTVIANGEWDVNCSITNWSRYGGGDDIDVDASDIQFINDDSTWDAGGEWPAEAINTTSRTYWDGSALGYGNTQEAGSLKDIYMRFAVPGGTQGGDYYQTLTVIIVEP